MQARFFLAHRCTRSSFTWKISHSKTQIGIPGGSALEGSWHEKTTDHENEGTGSCLCIPVR